jgi:Glycoside hydrolase family 5 C-terminal domain/Cellulase (glycosyl hydrolase family 5)
MPLFTTDKDGNFRDSSGRVILLRGINLDGSSKLPNGVTTYTLQDDNYWDGDKVSFVGKPFSLEEAPAHLERLKSWGYNTIRYLYTWEALEHEGPDQYDDAYIDHTIKLLNLIKEHGFYVFLDPHQDVWGRYSGGSGAPLWTYYAVGLDPKKFAVTQAALVQNAHPDPVNYPKMIWATNYYRYVCQLMFTLFFAGEAFAPKAVINGVNIQDYLQNQMLKAMIHFYKRIKQETDLFDTCIFGVETMNEANAGLVGFEDIGVIPKNQNLRLGTNPTAFQSMLLASGYSTKVEVYRFGALGPSKERTQIIDPQGVNCFVEDDSKDRKYGWQRDSDWVLGECIWAQHGVWSKLTQELIIPDYFCNQRGTYIDEGYFTNNFFKKYWKVFYTALRDFDKSLYLLCQPPVLFVPPLLKDTKWIDKNVIYAPHFYDGLTIMLKSWNSTWNVDGLGYLRGKYSLPVFAIKIGEGNVRKCLAEQISTMRREGLENMGPIPCLMSETGVPMDMNERIAYETGDYTQQQKALDAMSNALEVAGISHTLWGYTSSNSITYGDYWNGEDYSLWSREGEPDSSVYEEKKTKGVVRAKRAVIRPYPMAVAGTVTSYSFDINNQSFTLNINSEQGMDAIDSSPTEIFLPSLHFSDPDIVVKLSSGKWSFDPEVEMLYWWHEEGEQSLVVKPAGSSSQSQGWSLNSICNSIASWCDW